MDKTGKTGMRCTYCDNMALPDTYPPVCHDHKDFEKKADTDTSLKELERTGHIWRNSDEL